MLFSRINVLLFALTATAGAVISMGSQAADVDNITMNFTGEIRASTCDVGTLSSDQTVVLGDISTTLFNTPGDMSPARPFSISLSCPEGGPEQASVTFSGQASTDSTLLALDDDPGGASGVAVQIAESDGTKVSLGTNSATKSLVSGENVLNFTARYQSLVERSAITPGVANATSQFTINYP
ncbi:type 1 fimbrial protein (plasmid) [Serratia sp. AXJ-M]|uniref:fimbrial protein n=1 Tax=Serratia sp. AXJ-M TaxID=2754727 RepID=UPI00397D5088